MISAFSSGNLENHYFLIGGFTMSSCPPSITSLNNNLMKLESSFLDIKSLAELARTSRFLRDSLRKLLKASELLDCVVNINEESRKRIQELLEEEKINRADVFSLNLKSIMLIRTYGRVRYFSSKQRKIAYRDVFLDFSPLQAAADCGDFFLVDLFKDALPDNQKYAAGIQLKKILERKDYLLSFYNLHFAYQKFLIVFPKLEAAAKWRTIRKQWEIVAELQKKLPNFGLQVFCNVVTHVPVPDFTREPKRRMLLYYDRKDLDLDSMGNGTGLGLFKGRGTGAQLWSASESAGIPVGKGGRRAEEDTNAWAILCVVIASKMAEIASFLLQYEPDKDQINACDSKTPRKEYQNPPAKLPGNAIKLVDATMLHAYLGLGSQSRDQSKDKEILEDKGLEKKAKANTTATAKERLI